MKEPYDEDLASHVDPESCVGVREGVDEALTGACAGAVLNREITRVRDADVVSASRRQHRAIRHGENGHDLARSETCCKHRNTSRENREIPCPPWDGVQGRFGKPRGTSRR